MIKCLLSQRMSQRSITAFFKPNQSVKRKLSESQANDVDNDSVKQYYERNFAKHLSEY